MRGELKEAWAWSDEPESSGGDKTAAAASSEASAIADTTLAVDSADPEGHSGDDREGAENDGDGDQKTRKRKSKKKRS